jgi:uncharacterized protein YndB with AHSA1/START domain
MMGRYDVVDEIVIAAPAEAVWNALIDEARGDSGWWRPYVELCRGGDASVDQPGAVLDIAVHPDGERRRPIEPRFSSRTVEVEPNRRLRGEYFAGWFRGTSEWVLEPVEEGTLVRFRWAARTHGILPTLLGLFVDVGERHSEVTRKGLASLARYVLARAAPPRPADEAPQSMPA